MYVWMPIMYKVILLHHHVVHLNSTPTVPRMPSATDLLARELFFRSSGTVGFRFCSKEQATAFMKVFDVSDKTVISLTNWKNAPAPYTAGQSQTVKTRACVLCKSPNTRTEVVSRQVIDCINKHHVERGNGEHRCLKCGYNVEGVTREDHDEAHGRLSQLLPSWKETVYWRMDGGTEEDDQVFDQYRVSFAPSYVDDVEGEEEEEEEED